MAHDRIGLEPDAAAADHQPGPRVGGPAPADAVGEGEEEELHESLVGALGGRRSGGTAPGDSQVVVAGLDDAPRDRGIDTPLAQSRVESRGFGLGEPVEADEHVGLRVRLRAGPGIDAVQDVLLGEQGGGRGPLTEQPCRVRRPEEPGHAGRRRDVEQAAAVRRDPPRLDGPKHLQDPPGRLDPIRGRPLEPAELRRVGAPGMEGEHGAREVDTVDLGDVRFGHPALLALGPEPDTPPRPRPPGPAGPLRRRRPADPPQLEPVDPAPRVERGVSGQPAIDHGRDALDRQRRLGDVRRQDDLRAIARPEGAVLLFG